MINDNFSFKKLLKESIQERENRHWIREEEEAPRASAARRGRSWRPPGADARRGAESAGTPLRAALEFDLADFDLNRASPEKIEAYVGKLEPMVVALLDAAPEGDFKTKAQNIWNTFKKLKKQEIGIKLNGMTKLMPALQKHWQQRDAAAKERASGITGDPGRGAGGGTGTGGERGGRRPPGEEAAAEETAAEETAAEETAAEETPTTLSALLLAPVNPEDKSKGFKPKEHEPGSMASRINIALNNLSDPGLKTSYPGFKKKPNASNRKSFMSNLGNLKKALDRANVKIENMDIKQKSMKIINKSGLDTSPIEEMLEDFYPFAQKRFGFGREPCLEFLSDQENSGQILGKTAFYEPNLEKISIYVDKRHPKDIMRSFSHELVHHTQNCNGELGGKHQTGEGYAQADEHLRKMEEQAYLHGNMCFRDWEDGYKRSNPLQEQKERLYYELMKKLW